MKQNYLEELIRQGANISITLTLDDLQGLIEDTVKATLERMESTSKEPETWLTAEQVAERLGVDRSTLWRWEREEYLVPERFGRRVRYAESAVTLIELTEKKNL